MGETAFNDFKMATGSNKIVMNTFTRKLRSFVELCPWVSELNPEEFQNGQGRIIRRDKDAALGTPAVEMIYLRSVKPEDEDAKVQKELELFMKEHPDDSPI